MREESTFLRKEPCPACGSRDNLARYSDGHGHCFGCGHYERGEGEESASPRQGHKRVANLVEGGEFVALVKRSISEDTVRKFGYRVGTFEGRPCHIAPFYDAEGVLVAQKLRFPDKTFKVIGDMKRAALFGQHLWGQGGKRVVITTGEIDTLSVSQLQGNKWPVVSVKNGDNAAAREIKAQLEWLETYDEIVLAFDMDESGQKAARECIDLFSPGKAKLAHLPLKDANECLTGGKGQDVISAIWNAKAYRPDGIIGGEEMSLEELMSPSAAGFALQYPKLSAMLHGLRKRELTLLTAGSGIGKSTLARQIAYQLHQTHGLTIGNVYLEESAAKTAQGYIALDNNIALGRLREDPSLLTTEQWTSSKARVVDDRMFFYKHFGSLDSDNLLSKLRYMAKGLGVDFIVLDHISIVVSGQESSQEGERKDIDRLMTKLRSLVEETGVGIIAIVHLKQPEGTPHEEGGRVTLSQLRGSGSLKQLSDNVVALERDQQNAEAANICLVRILKNREFGEVGEADFIGYDHMTGLLEPCAQPAGGGFKDETRPEPPKGTSPYDDEVPF